MHIKLNENIWYNELKPIDIFHHSLKIIPKSSLTYLNCSSTQQGFCKNIWLFISWDKLQVNGTLLNMISYKMMFNFNMLKEHTCFINKIKQI